MLEGVCFVFSQYETSDLVQTIHRDYEKRLIDLLDHEQ